MANKKLQEMLVTGNYIYLYHTDTYLMLPTFPESIVDTLSSTFNQTNALSRSAPIFTYSYSGPRTIEFQFTLHRDMFEQANNYGLSNAKLEVGQDYFDYLIANLQSAALPKYTIGSKSVIPPLVAVRIGESDSIFIKGVINGSVSVSYSGPMSRDGKYMVVSVSFTVSEIDPYDATTVAKLGSFRGITRAFREGRFSE